MKDRKQFEEQIIEIDEDGKVHGDISGLKPQDSFEQVIKDLRTANVQGPDVKPIKEALNWIADRIERLLEERLHREARCFSTSK